MIKVITEYLGTLGNLPIIIAGDLNTEKSFTLENMAYSNSATNMITQFCSNLTNKSLKTFSSSGNWDEDQHATSIDQVYALGQTNKSFNSLTIRQDLRISTHALIEWKMNMEPLCQRSATVG